MFHIGLVTFNCHFPKNRKFVLVIIFWPDGNVHDSKNHHSSFRTHQNYQQQEERPTHFQKQYRWTSQNPKSRFLLKRHVPTNPEDQSYNFLRVLNMESRSFIKHDMDLFKTLEYGINTFEKHKMGIWYWIWNQYLRKPAAETVYWKWDQYLQENMERESDKFQLQTL